MWELDCEEGWAPKNWCFWTVVLEKTLESPLDCKEIQSVHSEGDQSWVFTGKTDVEAETPILCPPDAKTWLIWKDPDAEKDWRQEEKRITEEEMVGTNSMDMSLSELREMMKRVGKLGMLQSLGSQRVRYNWLTEQQIPNLGRNCRFWWATQTLPQRAKYWSLEDLQRSLDEKGEEM